MDTRHTVDVAEISILDYPPTSEIALNGTDLTGRVRLEAHLLLFIEHGEASVEIELEQRRLARGSFAWLHPGECVQVSLDDGAHAVLVLASQSIVTHATAGVSRVDDPLLPSVWALDDAQYDDIHAAIRHLQHELTATGRPETARARILLHLLAVLMIQLALLGEPLPERDGDVNAIFRSFRGLVEEHYRERLAVNTYAARMGYSPRTITRATSIAAGVSAKEFIDRRLYLEARRLIAYTDDAVGSIAVSLGFDDATNFTKFFRQRSGATPTQFRSEHTLRWS
ncbi:helix-turn-helix domain-containing protein [Microbacterium sp. SSM24]|uniref:helix-turn-helix domain-containing protein n=1 Tax=Microbacterium sp. SSM24 TaxID=2991714 RepID=UPI002227A2F2|nr:AraC family transcriptional regulator [Microbacterium sp. SSM24]MCW3492622.1 AraC family transcriptional regulator [Microbacterium sp. SSM24]